MEQWRAIPGWEGYYEVSDCGRVRSVPRTATFSDGRVRHFPTRIRALHLSGDYLKVTLKRPGKNERIGVHILVAAAWHGPRPAGLEVCHNDGNPRNNWWENLRYDTSKGNKDDMLRHGTRPRGFALKHTKLSDAEVRAIREARGKLTQGELAALFNTSKTHVCNIQKGNRR